mgnify:CR=1 FL=1
MARLNTDVWRAATAEATSDCMHLSSVALPGYGRPSGSHARCSSNSAKGGPNADSPTLKAHMPTIAAAAALFLCPSLITFGWSVALLARRYS